MTESTVKPALKPAGKPVVLCTLPLHAAGLELLGGAVIDVFAQQPLPRDSAFLSLDKVLLTPHAAGLTPESFTAMSSGAARQMLQLFANQRPTHLVNPEVWERFIARRTA